MLWVFPYISCLSSKLVSSNGSICLCIILVIVRYSILSILRDTDNTPASNSCIRQSTWYNDLQFHVDAYDRLPTLGKKKGRELFRPPTYIAFCIDNFQPCVLVNRQKNVFSLHKFGLFPQIPDIGSVLRITRVSGNIEKSGLQVADKGWVPHLGDSVDC